MNEEIHIDISEKFSCSICLNTELAIENMCQTNCSHEFCKDCLSDWFNQGKDSCPMCRQQIKNYKNNDKEYNLIRITQTNESENQVNGIPVLLLIQNLLKLNAKLKCYAYVTTAWLFYSVNQIISYYLANHDINMKLESCEYNYTQLESLLYSNDFKNVLMLEENTNSVRQCSIPEYFYDKCFLFN